MRSRRLRWGVGLTFWLVCLVTGAQTGQNEGKASHFRVLAFYTEQTEGDHVEFAHDALHFFADAAERGNYTWSATTDWNQLNEKNVAGFDVVVWLNDEPHTAAQRAAFESYMEHGGGWLGFHASAYNDAETGWPWFVQFLGGAVFYSNNWPPLPAQLLIEAKDSPVTAGVPGEYLSPPNEWYVWKPDPRANKDVRILVSLEAANYPLGLKDVLLAGDLPVVWTNTRYRMVYMNMGHGNRIFDSTIQNRLILQALQFAGSKSAAKK